MAKKVNLDVAQTLNITCRRGDTFQLNMVLKDSTGTPIDLNPTAANPEANDYAFSMQVRESAEQDGAVGLFASTVEGLPQEAANGSYITIEEITGTVNGEVEILISDANMKTFPSGRYVYDLQYRLPSGDTRGNDLTKTILKGAFVVNEDVTESNLAPESRAINPLGR